MFCHIYKITNTINDKVYIGQTWQELRERWYSHKSHDNCIKLSRAMKKYDVANFSIKLITLCHTQEVADQLEQYFIEKYNSIENGYNVNQGGRIGGFTGRKHTPEAKEKVAASKRGVPRSEETKMKLSIAKTGIKLGPQNPEMVARRIAKAAITRRLNELESKKGKK